MSPKKKSKRIYPEKNDIGPPGMMNNRQQRKQSTTLLINDFQPPMATLPCMNYDTQLLGKVPLIHDLHLPIPKPSIPPSVNIYIFQVAKVNVIKFLTSSSAYFRLKLLPPHLPNAILFSRDAHLMLYPIATTF